MYKFYCDLCKKEVPEIDKFVIGIHYPEDGQPAVQDKEICVFCKEKLLRLLENWE